MRKLTRDEEWYIALLESWQMEDVVITFQCRKARREI
jgi:hypothetical protein